MRKRKLGEDAFSYFVSLGAGRRHQDVATKFGVARRTVVSAAKREHWGERLERASRLRARFAITCAGTSTGEAAARSSPDAADARCARGTSSVGSISGAGARGSSGT
jgi:hypothetical protein